MGILRVILHGLVLLLANLAGVFAGFICWHCLKMANQIAVQAPIAAVVSILLFLVWTLLLIVVSFKKMRLQSFSEFVFAFVCALAWNPIVFVPLHYFTQGYVTDAGNVIALWLLQIPVNALAVLGAMKATQLFGARDFAAPLASQSS